MILGACHEAVGRGVDLGADRAGEIDAGMQGGAAAEGVGADAEAAGEGGALDGLDGWDGEGALFDLVESLPGGKELFELGIGRGAERLDRLEWTTGALEALRIETEVAKRLLRHLVALVGHRLDRLHVGLHRLDLLLHPSHLGRIDRPGGGELRGGESGPADQEKGGQRRPPLNRNANADAAQAFAVLEENNTRFENVAERKNPYDVLPIEKAWCRERR